METCLTSDLHVCASDTELLLQRHKRHQHLERNSRILESGSIQQYNKHHQAHLKSPDTLSVRTSVVSCDQPTSKRLLQELSWFQGRLARLTVPCSPSRQTHRGLVWNDTKQQQLQQQLQQLSADAAENV